MEFAATYALLGYAFLEISWFLGLVSSMVWYIHLEHWGRCAMLTYILLSWKRVETIKYRGLPTGEIAYASAVFFEMFISTWLWSKSTKILQQPERKNPAHRMYESLRNDITNKTKVLKLSETNSSHQKHGIPKGKDRPPTSNHQFSGALAVSFREGINGIFRIFCTQLKEK